MKTLILDLEKAKPVDREMYMCTYFNEEQKHKPASVPFVINIQGTYIKLDNLLELIPKKHKKEISVWITEIEGKKPTSVDPYIFPPFNFKWKRGDKDRV